MNRQDQILQDWLDAAHQFAGGHLSFFDFIGNTINTGLELGQSQDLHLNNVWMGWDVARTAAAISFGKQLGSDSRHDTPELKTAAENNS